MNSISKIALEYATTEDEQRARELYQILVAYFLTIYDDEKHRFASELKIRHEFTEDANVRFNFMLKIQVLLNELRTNVQIKVASEDDEKKLESYTIMAFSRIYNTEKKRAKELAKIETAKQYEIANPQKRIMKRWVAHKDCCEICLALDGTTVGLNESFMYLGQVIELGSGKLFANNYEQMMTPNAHPNDKCTIEFIVK